MIPESDESEAAARMRALEARRSELIREIREVDEELRTLRRRDVELTS